MISLLIEGLYIQKERGVSLILNFLILLWKSSTIHDFFYYVFFNYHYIYKFNDNCTINNMKSIKEKYVQ